MSSFRLPTLAELRLTLPFVDSAQPWRLVRYASIDWTIIVLCWAAMRAMPNPFAYAVGVLLIAGRLQSFGVILHDACHLPARRLSLPLALVEAFAGWTIGSSIAAMRYHHLRHHRAVGTRQDPYLHRLSARGGWVRRVMMLRGALLPLWWPLRALMAPVALAWPAFRSWYARGFLQDRSHAELRRHPEVIACARHDLPHCVAYWLAITAVVHWDLPFMAYYGLPWVLGGIMNANRVLLEHEHVEVGERAPETIWSMTRTLGFGWFGKLVLYPRNIGFHQVHHAYPALALEHLPAVHHHLQTHINQGIASTGSTANRT
ncbi:fatty acid desaturase family protein [Paraburkholderia oxyphila]|uniref:fatty acid desaturase family protein n=1 Tax=Paraburkholderia oxyphila TaxID=614212 RepID=UPI0005B7C955|nr:fatty acid desaturase family protein [Paraburkholderia oxyphila]